MFSSEELAFLYQVLDQIQMRGLDQKTVIVQLMTKIAEKLKEEDDEEA